MKEKIKVWGHRGTPDHAPENTLVSFQKAIELGVTGLEFDVQLTKDGIPVVIHDETIDRVSNGKGWVKDYTLEELKRFNYNCDKDGYDYESIPTLEELLCILSEIDITINIELKTNVIFYFNIEQKVIDLVLKYSLRNRVIISSFNPYSIIKVKELDSKIKTALLVDEIITSIVDYAHNMNVEAIHLPGVYLDNDEEIKSIYDNGYELNIYNVQSNYLSNDNLKYVNAVMLDNPILKKIHLIEYEDSKILNKYRY